MPSDGWWKQKIPTFYPKMCMRFEIMLLNHGSSFLKITSKMPRQMSVLLFFCFPIPSKKCLCVTFKFENDIASASQGFLYTIILNQILGIKDLVLEKIISHLRWKISRNLSSKKT